MHLRLFLTTLILSFMVALGACQDSLPDVSELPEITLPELPVDLPDIPGLPSSLQEIPDLVKELGLPDLSQFVDLPQLDDLPLLNTPDDAIAFRGPTEHRIDIGQRIPGTDIELAAIQNGEAEFRIAGLRSVRVSGDSLDFDGDWAGLGGVSYSLRLRIYRVGEESVRAAGVQQLIVRDVQPAPGQINPDAATISFPYTVGANVGGALAGTTFGYIGTNDRGAEIAGLPSGDYPFHKMGDSLRWRGFLRGDIPADYNLRILYYGEDSVRVGGIVHIALPGLQ